MSQDFDVGGGAGDNDTSTPSSAHVPMQRFTEGPANATENKKHMVFAGKNAPKEAMPASDGDWATWKVDVPGGVNVRRSMSKTGTVINIKKSGVEFQGRKQGNWVELADAAGFMMVKFKGMTLLKKVLPNKDNAKDLGGS